MRTQTLIRFGRTGAGTASGDAGLTAPRVVRRIEIPQLNLGQTLMGAVQREMVFVPD